MTVEAVLWDLDGVIVNSGRYHFEAYREVLTPLGCDLTEEDYLSRFFGRRNHDILRTLLGDLPDERIAEVAVRKEEAFRRLVRGRIVALPGAADLLRRAHEAGIRQSIVSSTPRANIDMVLSTLGLGGYLDEVVGEEDVSRGKPDPEGFLTAAERLGVAPARCGVVEDAPEGIAAGKAAGMRCLAVATTRPPERLTQADVIVATLEDPVAAAFILGG